MIAVWGACGLCPNSRAHCAGTSFSGICPAGKLQWHFTFGFEFRHGLWLLFGAASAVLKELLIVPVETMNLFSLGITLSGLWEGGGGGLWAVSKVESSTRVPCLLKFILLVNFSDTLLVVSISDIWGCFCSSEGVNYNNSPWMNPKISSSLRKRAKLTKLFYKNSSDSLKELLMSKPIECSNLIVTIS